MYFRNAGSQQEMIRARWPAVRVIALSIHDSEYAIIRALQGGAAGILHKDCSPGGLKLAIETVIATEFYHSQLVDTPVRDEIRTGNGARLTRITDREKAFLAWGCCYLSYKEITVRMDIGVRNVESYADRLCDKLGAKSRTGLVMAAFQMGIQPATDLPQ